MKLLMVENFAWVMPQNQSRVMWSNVQMAQWTAHGMIGDFGESAQRHVVVEQPEGPVPLMMLKMVVPHVMVDLMILENAILKNAQLIAHGDLGLHSVTAGIPCHFSPLTF